MSGRRGGVCGPVDRTAVRTMTYSVKVCDLIIRDAAMSTITSTNVEMLRRERDAAQRRADGLSRVIELISSELALRPLLARIVESAVDLVGARYGSIGLIRSGVDGPIVQWLAGKNVPPQHLDMETPAGTGIAGAVLRARRPVCVSRSGDLLSLVTPEPAEHAMIGIPIWWKGQITGVFDLGDEPHRRFDDEDIETLSMLARHAAIAIENARLFEKQQRTLDSTQLLYETSRRISTAMNVNDVITAYLEQVAAGGQYHSTVSLFETDEQGQRTALVSRMRWSPSDGLVRSDVRFPFDSLTGIIEVLDAGETVTIPDITADTRVSGLIRRLQIEVGRPAVALMPLIAGERHLGAVSLSCADRHEWIEADLRPYQVTAAQLAAAIDSRQQQMLLFERGQQIAVLEERRRLARELHDSVTQSLVGMNLLAQSVPDLWEIDREEARASLLQIRDQTRSALAEMRALLVELRPAPAGTQSLAWRLRRHIAAFEQRTGLTVAADIDERIDPPGEVAEALARIAQEALTNIARHAGARRVSLTSAGSEPVRLLIVDDGRGFDSNHVSEGRFGLLSMRERATGIAAAIEILSQVGHGTTVAVTWLPSRTVA